MSVRHQTNVNANTNINANTNVNKYKKYIPPNKQSTLTNSTVEKAPKKTTYANKEFSLLEQSDAFPSLSTYKDVNSQNIKSFANATKTEMSKPQKIISDVKPGWVHIRKHNNVVEFKYGAPSDRNPFPCEISDIRLGEILVKHRLAKEQYDRECDIERLGDLSEYYGEQTAQEQFEEDERLMHKLNGTDSDNDSMISETCETIE